jgi:hypothetical protein
MHATSELGLPQTLAPHAWQVNFVLMFGLARLPGRLRAFQVEPPAGGGECCEHFSKFTAAGDVMHPMPVLPDAYLLGFRRAKRKCGASFTRWPTFDDVLMPIDHIPARASGRGCYGRKHESQIRHTPPRYSGELLDAHAVHEEDNTDVSAQRQDEHQTRRLY